MSTAECELLNNASKIREFDRVLRIEDFAED